MRILGLTGSYRKNGNTHILVEKVLEGARALGAETESIFLPDHDIKDCIGCEGCRTSYKCVIKDGMQAIYPKLEAADAIVLGSPTYFYNVTGIVKNFLDRMYCYELFDDANRSVWMALFEATGIKYAVTVAVCEQADEADMGYTAVTMNQSLWAVGYRVVDTVKALHVYKKGEITEHTSFLDHAAAAGQKLAKTIQLRRNTEAILAERALRAGG